jgi:type II secretory pathway pseudopilin PulG
MLAETVVALALASLMIAAVVALMSSARKARVALAERREALRLAEQVAWLIAEGNNLDPAHSGKVTVHEVEGASGQSVRWFEVEARVGRASAVLFVPSRREVVP